MSNRILDTKLFIQARPDMEIHQEASINSAINSAFVLLDGECAGLISQVENYMLNNSDIDNNNILYRNSFEMGQLKEALIFQTQYNLNMGNDFTVGGGSYSIGNINSSYSRPEGRELIAPGVFKLLSNARVYNLNAFGSFDKKNNKEIPLKTSEEILEQVKNAYVAINQPNAQIGQVAYVNENNKVDFGNPEDLQITTYNTKKIAGPEGYRTNFYEIDKVPNIAFFGPDLNGTFSAVHRDEIIKTLEQYYSKEEVQLLIYSSGIEWSPNIEYKEGWIVQIVNEQNFLEFYKAKETNIGKDPRDKHNKQYWDKVHNQEIDLNQVVNQLKPFIENLINRNLSEEVNKQLQALPEADYVQETARQIIGFETIEDKKLYEKATGAKLEEIWPSFMNDINNLSLTKTQINNESIINGIHGEIFFNNGLTFFSGYWNTPEVVNTPKTICRKFDINKIVSITIGVCRGNDNTPLMFWPNIDLGSSPSNPKAVLPFTVEVNKNQELEIWRQASTVGDGSPWPRIYIWCLYVPGSQDSQSTFDWIREV